ncbi:MAG: phospho-N-acetylmuramoyl-pentapeptide-transferase [Acidimicrobiia bacterium]
MIALFLASALAFAVSVTLTPLVIKVLRKRDMGQHIRDDGPIVHPHVKKAGTPTMGGIAIVIGAIVGYFFAHVRTGFVFGRTALVIVLIMAAMALVGLYDDYLGIIKKRNLGLRKRGKFFGQVLFALIFAILTTRYVHISTSLSFARPITSALPEWVYIFIVVFIVIATTNALNITDGLDGLAAGSATIVFSAYTVISYWQFRHGDFYPNGAAGFSNNALDVAILTAAITGACAGFLWWNAAPAQIFMGDVGSLALGGAMAACAVVSKTELLLVLIGGIYVVETLSVIAQIISYRGFKKRVLKMAPLHHHFEVLGWPETTVIVRFWLLSGISVAMGIGIFYADFVRSGGAG